MSEGMLAPAYEQLLRMVGRRGPAIRAKLTRRDITRFATASGETSEIYHKVEAARAAGYSDLPCPPVMLSAVIEWGAGPPLAELREDGSGVGRERWLPLDGLRLMGGGQDLQFHAPAVAGTEVIAQPMLESVDFKEGHGGELLLMVIATQYWSGAGEQLVSCRETLIAR
jgi:hypothetical protein